jgi:hypothetical protein
MEGMRHMLSKEMESATPENIDPSDWREMNANGWMDRDSLKGAAADCTAAVFSVRAAHRREHKGGAYSCSRRIINFPAASGGVFVPRSL